jgi:hypothetical protein
MDGGDFCCWMVSFGDTKKREREKEKKGEKKGENKLIRTSSKTRY